MHLKRYRGKTLKEALRAVRQDLGPDALVLSTQVVQDRGPRGWLGGTVVEIAAAIERPDVADVSGVRHTVNDPIERELEALAARLGASGLEPGIARAVAASHPIEKRRTASAGNLHTTLAAQLQSLAAADDGFAPVEVFVGPPGAGKTTTIAKIAAQQRSRQGRRLGLVAADGYRVGAVEQLRLYAEVIGAPLTVAPDITVLAAARAMTDRNVSAAAVTDNDRLVPLLEAVKTNTEAVPEQVLADAGFRAEEVFEKLNQSSVELIVALGREGKQIAIDAAKYPRTAEMDAKLKTKEGQSAYHRRKWLSEPPNGWIKNVLGFRQFSMRGLSKVTAEWKLVCAALNLRRMSTMTTT